MSMKGNVKFWNVRKGWGMISGDDTRVYFGHFKDIVGGNSYRCLADGEPVEFEILTEQPNPRAIKIKPVSCQSDEGKNEGRNRQCISGTGKDPHEG